MKVYEKYLGTMGPEEFESVEEVRAYFSKDNLVYMFGPDQYDAAEAEQAMREVLEILGE